MLISQRETGYLGAIISHSLNNHYTLNLSGLSSLSILSIFAEKWKQRTWRQVPNQLPLRQ
ncbi:hypothetical protein [Gilliamella sp. B2838]|uniref:hypothetical protein n=1 Tax=Gilliamella sp. B2838 TaxID=2818020 RepID=UPI00226A536A|nr:hypothetical protein [Gilliamella sp. B2838]MCX8727363.1 hypothetical protein [Gilliamella sp. B2838]